MNVEDARFLEEGVNGCYNQGVNGKKRRKEPCDVCLGVSSYRERPWD